jgi:organic radical activating enzyme
MLKEYKNSDDHIGKKITHIVVTNVCNLTCGGCHQHCGNFEKKQLWFISPEEFSECIKILKMPENRLPVHNPNYITKISIFGGEPTIHPRWDDLLKIMEKNEDVLFRVSTNGRSFKDIKNPNDNFKINVSTLKKIIDIEKGDKKADKNIHYIIDPKDEEKVKNYDFVPVMVAPIDLYPEKNKKYFWTKAQRDCGIWRFCSKAIYNGKAYFCEVAASIDWLFDNGANGWELNDSPFKKTKEEIAEQAEKFCYRCAWCIKYDPALENYKQKIGEPTLISDTNNNFPKSSNFTNLVQITFPSKGSPPLREPNIQ